MPLYASGWYPRNSEDCSRDKVDAVQYSNAQSPAYDLYGELASYVPVLTAPDWIPPTMPPGYGRAELYPSYNLHMYFDSQYGDDGWQQDIFEPGYHLFIESDGRGANMPVGGQTPIVGRVNIDRGQWFSFSDISDLSGGSQFYFGDI